MSNFVTIAKIAFITASTVLAVIFIVRSVQAMRAPDLQLWHNYVPKEPSPDELDQMSWQDWLQHEKTLFQNLDEMLAEDLPRSQNVPQNRYAKDGVMNPSKLPQNWNHSFEIKPATPAKGVAVLLHGLSDSPYSLRHFANHYAANGWHVVGLRLPGHGTVPGGLTKATTEKWRAATAMAVRHARQTTPDKPLHLVGYSNGAALAAIHTLDSLEKPELHRPDQLVLVSPLVGLTPFARFSGLAALPSIFPAFVKSAWLDILPEFNPYKYNSFPVKAAVEAHKLTTELQSRLTQAKEAGRLSLMPPVLAFQSVVDSTVSAKAVREGLFDHLPENGSRLVLFDVNRSAYVGQLVSRNATEALNDILPSGLRPYAVSVVMNAHANSPETMIRHWPAGHVTPVETSLNIPYRRDFFSLGHIALPFPLSDGLYGANPDPSDVQGVSLGALATRGENGVLGVPANLLSRVSSNPFLSWMLTQIPMDQSAP